MLLAGERAGSVLVLDETTGDLDIDRGSVAAGFRGAEPGTVVRIGSLGKTVWGGLRVGWVRADGDLIRRLVAARPAHDLGTPEFEQAIATKVLDDFDAIIAQRSSLLGAGRDALTSALADELPEWRVPHVHGGVSLWIELDAALSSALVMDVRSRGVLLTAGPRFSIEGGHDRHLRVPFTAPPESLTRAVRELARSWEVVKAGAPTAIVDQVSAVV